MKNFSKVLIFIFMFSLITISVTADGPQLNKLKAFNGDIGNYKGQWKVINKVTDDVYDTFTGQKWQREITRVELILQEERRTEDRVIKGKFFPEKRGSAKYIVKEIGKKTYWDKVKREKATEGWYEVTKDKITGPVKKIWRYKKVK